MSIIREKSGAATLKKTRCSLATGFSPGCSYCQVALLSTGTTAVINQAAATKLHPSLNRLPLLLLPWDGWNHKGEESCVQFQFTRYREEQRTGGGKRVKAAAVADSRTTAPSATTTPEHAF